MLKRRVIVLLSLILLLLLLQQPANQPVTTQSTTYQNTGNPRPVVEYSEGTFSDTSIGPLPDNTTITVPARWNSTKVYTRVYNLLHKKDWVINGTFENGSSITGNPPSPWLYYEMGDIGGNNRSAGEIKSYWNISSPIGTGGAIVFNLTANSTIEPNEFAMWNETIYVDEGEVKSATIKVDVYAIDLTRIPGEGSKLSLTIWIFAAENYSYSQKFKDTVDGLQTIEIPLDPAIFSTPQNITIGIGVSASGNGGTVDSTNDIFCYDNAQLVLECLAMPSQVKLTFADGSNPLNNISVSNITFGEGEAVLETSVPWTGDVNFTFLAFTIGSVTLCANTTVYATHATQTDSSGFSVSSEENVDWTLAFLARQLPAPYIAYYFNVSYPLDWNVTSVLDSYGYEQFNTTEPNAYEYVTPSGKVLKCDVGKTGHYGVWTIYLVSNNYVQRFRVQYWDKNEAAWKDATGVLPSFYVNESTKIRICVQITNKSGGVPANHGIVNVTVYFPNGTEWFTKNVSSLDTQGWGTTSGFVLSASNASAGKYTVSICWTNGEEAGYIAGYLFIVIHRTSLSPEDPEYFVYRGDFVTIRVRFWDIDVDESVADADVSYSWVGGSGKMLYSGGWYIVDLDSSKAPGIGIYNVTINAQKFGYMNQSVIVKVEVQDPTELVSPVDKLTVYTGKSFTLNVCYNDTFTGEGIVNATVTYMWDFGSGSLAELGNGYYLLNLTPLVPGAYKITICAAKAGYADAYTDIVVLVTVLPTELVVERYEIVVPIGDNATIRVYYNNTEDNVGIINASVIYSWKFGVGYMADLGNGTYIINISTVNLPFDAYTITITAFKSGYEVQTVIVKLFVIKIPTELVAETPVISVIERSKFTIRIYYNDTWHNVLISGANVTYSWEFGNGTLIDLGNGTYIITLRAPPTRAEPYDIVIVAQKDLYETSIITISVVSKPSAVMLSLKALALGSGSAIAVMGGVASWYFYFRFPPFVRLVRSVSKRLEGGKSPKLGKVRDRKEIINDFIRGDYRVLLEKVPIPSKEGLEVEALEGEVEEELVEAGKETLKETAETIEKLTGVQLPEELKEEIEREEGEE